MFCNPGQFLVIFQRPFRLEIGADLGRFSVPILGTKFGPQNGNRLLTFLLNAPISDPIFGAQNRNRISPEWSEFLTGIGARRGAGGAQFFCTRQSQRGSGGIMFVGKYRPARPCAHRELAGGRVERFGRKQSEESCRLRALQRKVFFSSRCAT